MSVTAFVGVGSNIQPRIHVPRAMALLREHYGALTISPVYRCPAVGFEGPSFLNLVVAFDTGADALTVADTLHHIERICGRDRSSPSASRRMDLDLLLYGDLVSDAPGLRLPRADILRYAFTLKPLADIAPDARHPVDGRSYAELWAAFDAGEQPLEPVTLQSLAG